MKYLNHLIIVGIIFLLALTIFVGANTIDIMEKTEGSISVSGTGEVYATPDMASVSFAVINEAKEADEALAQNAEKTNQVIEFLKNEGIEGGDIKTTSFSINPRYEYRSEEDLFPPEGRRVLVGYEVNQTVEVNVRDIEKIGEILEGGVEEGANRVSNLLFLVEDKSELKKEAREIAIMKAKEEAKNIEKQLGVSLIRIVGFNEDSQTPHFYQRGVTQEMMMEDSIAPQIEPGENKIKSEVIITYEIR